MVKRSLLPAILALAVLSAGACTGNSFGITVGKESRDGFDQLTFDNVAGDVQYAVGSYKYTKVNGAWDPATHDPASPGLGYNDIHRKFDAMALFFRPELDYARFMIVTGMPSTGTTASNVGYGSRQFGPGDLKIDVGSVSYGVGLRQGGLVWGTVDPGPSQPWFRIHKAEGGTDIISARDTGTLGTIKKNAQWDRVDNHTATPYSEKAYAFFRADSGTLMPGTATVSFADTGVLLQGFSVHSYEVCVPWTSLEIDPAHFAFSASWRPDCGNDIIAANFSGSRGIVPPVPEASTLFLALSGLSAMGIVRRRR